LTNPIRPTVTFPPASALQTVFIDKPPIPEPDPKPEGLSTGAKAGIGVCVSLGVALIGILTFLFIVRIRRKRASKRQEVVDEDARVASDKELIQHAT
jgi:hypothetical protein